MSVGEEKKWDAGTQRRPDTGIESDDESLSETCPAEEDGKESWVDWLKRTTHLVESELREIGILDWVTNYKRRKWRWAYKLANYDDTRWSKRVFLWNPGAVKRNYRKVGRPVARWDDDFKALLQQFFGCFSGGWWQFAENRETWTNLENEFLR